MSLIKRVCVFCGSYDGARGVYAATTRTLGVSIARRGLELVYGGGKVGLMGNLADAALGAGGRVIGVIPKALADKEVAHRGVTELHIVKSMHERKALMAELADCFIALPGGFGTLEEFCEILTWAQLGFHRKALCLLNVGGFYDGFLRFMDHMVSEEFVRPLHRGIVIVGHSPENVLDLLETYEPPLVDKWMNVEDL